MPTTVNLADLVASPDAPLAVSAWLDVSQQMISVFAEVTGDTQWIHTDAVRAAQSPFGTTIAHGFLTLSLVTQMMADALTVAGSSMSVNYGLNKVRFTAPVPAGARVRGRFAVADVVPIDGGIHVTWSVTIERDGSAKPCCVAEWLVRYYR